MFAYLLNPAAFHVLSEHLNIKVKTFAILFGCDTCLCMSPFKDATYTEKFGELNAEEGDLTEDR
jgi:hypothetical protein